MKLEVRFTAVPVEAMRAFLEPLGYRFDWGPELDGIGFHWRKLPLSGTGVRATYFPDRGEGLLVLETDGSASAVDAAMQDVTARRWPSGSSGRRSGARRRSGPSTPAASRPSHRRRRRSAGLVLVSVAPVRCAPGPAAVG